MMKKAMSGVTVLAIVLGMPMFMLLMALITGGGRPEKARHPFPQNGSVEIIQDWMSEDYGPPKVLEKKSGKAPGPSGTDTAASEDAAGPAASDVGAVNPHIAIIEPESPASTLPFLAAADISDSSSSSSLDSDVASSDATPPPSTGAGLDDGSFFADLVAPSMAGRVDATPAPSALPDIAALSGAVAELPAVSPLSKATTGDSGVGQSVATIAAFMGAGARSAPASQPFGVVDGAPGDADSVDALSCTHECCNGRWAALLLLHIPATGGLELFAGVRDAFAQGAPRSAATCRTVHRSRQSGPAEEDPNVFDHIPADKPTIMHAVRTVNTVFPTRCQLLRMEYDMSMVDLVLPPRTRAQLGLLTVLRHPVDRLAALYLSSSLAKKMSFRDFLSGHLRHTRAYSGANHMAKMLAGTWPDSTLYKADKQAEVNEALLEVAKTNLARMCFAIYEQMEDSARMLTHVYGVEVAIRKPTSEEDDASDAGPALHLAIGEGDANLVLELNAVDVELYNFGVQLFAARYRALFAADPRPARPSYEYVMSSSLGVGGGSSRHIAASDADGVTFGSTFTHGLQGNDAPYHAPSAASKRLGKQQGWG